jgi:thiol-disulfide isomerase/thioredoxin
MMTRSGLFLVLITLLFTSCKSSSQKVVDEKVVTWETNMTEALAKAKANNELLFVECYSPTCSHCQAIEPFFKMPEVAKKYNSSFVNYKLNLLEEDQVKFLNDKNINLPSWPRFLFFDGDGNLVHHSSVEPEVESLLGIAEAAIDPKKQTVNYAKRFAEGERNVDFLTKYSTHAQVIQDVKVQTEAGNALFEAYPKDKLGSQESWSLTKLCITDVDNGFFKYWLNHQKEADANEAKEEHPESADKYLGGILQKTILSDRVKTYSVDKLQQLRGVFGKLGLTQYADNYLWEIETKALIKESNLPQALAIGNKMIKAFDGNSSAQVYITRVFNDNFPDNSHLSSVKTWLKNALPGITGDNIKTEYYYELARVNQKSGEMDEARKNAKTAQEMAVKVAADPAKFAEMISSLK